MEKSLQMLSIIGTLSTIILGGITIFIALYLHTLSSQINASLNKTLSDISKSTAKTEIVSTDILLPTIMQLTQANMQSRIESYGTSFVNKAGKKIDEILKADNLLDKEKAKVAFFQEVDKVFRNLRHEVGKVELISDLRPPKESTADQFSRAASGVVRMIQELTPSKVTGSSPSPKESSRNQNLVSFIRKMRKLESVHQFVAVKWLKETKFSDDIVAQETLQEAIDNEWLLTWREPNKKNPPYPFLACRLNQEHPTVKEILNSLQSQKPSLR
jgi:hypothetical protein